MKLPMNLPMTQKNFAAALALMTTLAVSACSTAIVKNPSDVNLARSETTAETPIHASAAAPTQVSSDDQARAALEAVKNNLRFKPYSAKLDSSAAQTLSQAAQALKSANKSVAVEGYADSTGSNELNERLSNARAATVRAFLIKNGIASNRVSAQGHGESNPAESNDTAEGRAANRRVEIKLN